MSDNLKDQLKPLLLSAKVMQFFADILAVMGIFLFAYLYFTKWNNNAWSAIRDPMFAFTVLIPFVPAACFAYMASKKRSKIRSMLDASKK